MEIRRLPSIDPEPIPQQSPMVRAFAAEAPALWDDDYSNLSRGFIKKPHEITKIYKSFRNIRPEDVIRDIAFKNDPH